MTPEDFLKACRLKGDKGFDSIKEFIDNKGKFKTIKGPSDTSPLHLAARAGNIKIVQLLISQDMNPLVRDKTKLGKTPIVDAIEKGFVDIALVMLASKKLKPLKVKKRYNETTALAKNNKISATDYKKLLSAIIKAGIAIELPDDQNHTALTRAVVNNEFDRVKICLELGFNPNFERNPLGLALHNDDDRTEIIKLLLDNGAELVIKSDDEWGGFNALHAAHYYHDPDAFGMLIKEYGALNTIDDETLDDIISHKEIEFLQYLWEIPKVHDFILKHNLEEAFPKEIQDLFIF